MTNIDRSLRTEELKALAAVIEAVNKAHANHQFTPLTRDGFLATVKSAVALIDDKLQEMYTHG
jgi:hypothetical protein